MEHLEYAVLKFGIAAGIIGVGLGISGNLDNISKEIEELKQVPIEYKLQERNVLGNINLPEKFYDMNGDTAYIEIDGKPIKQYFAERTNTN